MGYRWLLIRIPQDPRSSLLISDNTFRLHILKCTDHFPTNGGGKNYPLSFCILYKNLHPCIHLLNLPIVYTAFIIQLSVPCSMGVSKKVKGFFNFSPGRVVTLVEKQRKELWQQNSRNSDTIASSGRELYHLQFSLQAASPDSFGYTVVDYWTDKVARSRPKRVIC